MRYLLFPLAACLLTVHAIHAAPEKDPVHGVTISTHGGGRDWGSDAIVPTMEEIRSIGANWVSIHPYARINIDGSVRFQLIDPDDPPAHIIRPIREAHALGLKICIKPHLAYWGSPFTWRGEIEFSNDEEWARFWRDYRQWIVQLAQACRQADAFIVGTELDRMLHAEDQWRGLIAEVRQHTDAPLSYAANWPDYQRVPFWDALDIIGIQAYFPLTEHPNPDAAQLKAAWTQRMAELRAYAEQMNRNIVFTELGYNRSHLAPVKPWEYQVDDDAHPIQEACMRAALQAIDEEPRVVGALLWKWFIQPRSVGRNFQLATPPLKNLIAEFWNAQK
jgi:hypothetical protein